jgi:sterol desaturase/sphingolipid hydroxylase (fatty acid hydroxylase superfamily)
MASVHTWFSWFSLDQLAPIKAAAKAWAYSHHLAPVWDGVRDRVLTTILNYKVWTLGLVPCLFLETVFPAVIENEARRASRWMDFCYPIFSGLALFPFVSILTTGLDRLFRENAPFLNTGLLDGKPMLLQVIGAFLIGDFLTYVTHYLRHKVRWFWFFHSIHHSQENLNPFTAHRVHAFEAIINTFVRTVPIAFVGGKPAHWTFLIVFNATWDFFTHANLRTDLGPLGRFIVSPQFHRIHHSALPQHFDKNFGERIVLWDWLFGTMEKDTHVYPPTGVRGIEPWAVERGTSPRQLVGSWVRQTAYPFVKIGQSLRRSERSEIRSGQRS